MVSKSSQAIIKAYKHEIQSLPFFFCQAWKVRHIFVTMTDVHFSSYSSHLNIAKSCSQPQHALGTLLLPSHSQKEICNSSCASQIHHHHYGFVITMTRTPAALFESDCEWGAIQSVLLLTVVGIVHFNRYKHEVEAPPYAGCEDPRDTVAHTLLHTDTHGCTKVKTNE